ncbi:MAG: YggS family pyridoxal phosphate-dependent enzyme [Anaerolineales bacterium]
MIDLVAIIREKMDRFRENVSRIATRCGRNPQEITIVIVTKAQPIEVVQAAIGAGATCLGENYPEEAQEKIRAIKADNVEWHMIGHLQSRKSKIVVELFDMLHSLDSVHLAQKLSLLCQQVNRVLPVLLQFNVSGEESKYGWHAWDESGWDTLLPELERIIALPGLQIKGLMTMPPLFENPEQVRPYFSRLRVLRDYLSRHFPNVIWNDLSMGTSVDYPIAIQEGATYIRIGEAILGPRPTKFHHRQGSDK